jgi:hypothetical protein
MNSASGTSTGNSNNAVTTTYGRGDLQAAFNWLVNQPGHVRKQASDPDRLMTLYYRSNTRLEATRIETEAPVSSQTFISDLRQINETMRQFDAPSGAAFTQSNTVQTNTVQTATVQTVRSSGFAPPILTAPLVPQNAIMSDRSQAIVQEVREKLNLSSDAEAMNVLISLGHKALRSVLG